MSSKGGPDINENGLVLFLDAANRLSYPGTGTTWTDLSGNGRNGTIVGPTYSTLNGGAFLLNNNRIDLSGLTAFGPTQPHTYSVWIKFSSSSGTYMWVLNNGDNSRGDSLIVRYGDRIGYFYNGGASVNSGNLILNYNKWNNLCITYESGGAVKMYLNGVFDVGFNVTISTPVSNSGPRIGSWYNDGYGYTGYIANLMIYNRALSASEVLQNFNALRGRYGV